jgi:hypothetical protein
VPITIEIAQKLALISFSKPGYSRIGDPSGRALSEWLRIGPPTLSVVGVFAQGDACWEGQYSSSGRSEPAFAEDDTLNISIGASEFLQNHLDSNAHA